MYEPDKAYKFELVKGIYYTGKVISEDDILIKVKTQRDEILILNKNHIVQSIQIEQNR